MDKIQKFIEMQEAQATRTTYNNTFNQYFKRIKCNPENYLNQERDFSMDLWRFYQSLKDYAPTSRRTYVTIIINFFEWYEILIDVKIRKRIKRGLRNAHPISLDKAPTQHELKEILSHGDLKARALFLTLSSSGMRIGEALSLLPDQLDLDSSPARIHILHKNSKNKRPRICYISNEARDALIQWLTPHKFKEDDGREFHESERERYLRYACNKIKNFHIPKSRDDPRVFPFNLNSARKAWMRMIKRAGYTKRNPETKRHDFHIHSLRKFFVSNMKTQVPDSIVEQLVGHSGYLNGAYSRYTEEQLAKYYLEGVSSVKVFDTNPETTELQEKIKELKEENKQVREQLNKQKTDYDDSMDIAYKFHKELQEIRKRLDEVERERDYYHSES